VHYRIAIGPHAGRKALTLYSVPPMEERSNIPLLAKVAGFSLHAATVCEAYQRSRLERLCRYITRPPIATKRLSVDGRGRVVYQYKQPFRDGSTHVVLEPLDFIARLAALVPRPRLKPRRPGGTVDCDQPVAPMSWPFPHIPVLHGTGTSCPMDATPQMCLRHRYRDLSRLWRNITGHRLH
jgi:hypothetical protein